jgi:hypothetical protein
VIAELGLVILRDNALVNCTLSVQQFLSVKGMAVVSELPCSPGLAPCDFFVSKNEIAPMKPLCA